MTKNTIFFKSNYENNNPFNVDKIDIITECISISEGKVINMDVILILTPIYPNPLIQVLISKNGESYCSYIDMLEHKYIQPVEYDTGLIRDKCYHLNDDELEILDEAFYTKSSLFGSSYEEIFEKTKKYKDIIIEWATLCGDLKLLRKIKYNKKNHSYIPTLVKFGLKEEK